MRFVNKAVLDDVDAVAVMVLAEAPSRYAARHPQPRRLARPSHVVVIPALSRDPFQVA